MRQKRIRVFCVDDSTEIVELMNALVNDENDLDYVGSALTTDGLLDTVATTRPDVVLLDINIPGPNPMEMVRLLADNFPEIRVLLFSGYDDQDLRDQGYEAGAWGLVSKNSDSTEILDAVRLVAGGEVFFRAAANPWLR